MHCDQCDTIIVLDAGPTYVGRVEVEIMSAFVKSKRSRPDFLKGTYCSKKCARAALAKILEL